eukprot:326598-Amphidinium_carterae.1
MSCRKDGGTVMTTSRSWWRGSNAMPIQVCMPVVRSPLRHETGTPKASQRRISKSAWTATSSQGPENTMAGSSM